ncbi:glycosyltransferase [Pseudomonas mosselii]|uniref:glycosyltransferase n=1 Tax=Pseudomonas mosselii TaxID=78327 RepID=UPI001F310388|nr:glycosyltransferase [Pseudomonas mosselii]MDH0629783.1 glycosyltransferase [Pseudomonas mosselii]MDH0678887.1 glycosyltransferase [Pseudomonas mosselii]MDH0927669.1 glycosyltransferase [Pseudomonas mosselii]MDH1135750.1 glycosyltransferase [Pseudomonas mosselii]MDH1140233.1 glycosyltransferase [Pseudomonas mosselii]
MLSATVVVSCYNQERYIAECLESILGQEVNFDLEVIVSDDCSTDSTQRIIRECAEKHPGRLKLVLREQNVGVSNNYYAVHALATGDVVFHFDGDDIMMSGKLQEQYDLFVQYPDVNIVFHKAVYFSDDRSYQSIPPYPGEGAPYHTFFSLQELARWGSTCVHSAYAYRRSARKVTAAQESMEWYFAMDTMIPSGRGVFINKPLVMYRCNPGNGSYLSTLAGRTKAYRIYFRDVADYFDSHPELRTDLYANFLVTFLAMARSTRKVLPENLAFGLKNIFYFRPRKFIQAVQVRRLVGPEEKVR